MGVSRKKALQYAEKIISVPRSRVLVTLRHGQEGVTLLHGGRAVAKVFVNRSGIRAAAFMARALGTKVPPLGRAVQARVSTGVLWRAVSISALDFRKPESYVLVERLMEEAEMMRESTGEGV